MIRIYKFITIVNFFFLGLTGVVFAQNAVQEEPPVVERLDIQFKGVKNYSVDSALAFIKLRAGMVYNQELVNQSIKALYATDNYDYIEVKRRVLNEKEIVVTFYLSPKYKIESICFEGNSQYGDKKLRKQIGSKEGNVLSESEINQDANKLFEFYQKKGYSQVKITPLVTRNDENGTGSVVFCIDEGSKIKINDISFCGTDCYKEGDLRDLMRTKEWNVLSWFTGKGRYEEETFHEDIAALRRYFMNEGYLDVNLDDDSVDFSYPKECEMDICINVDLGNVYYIGDIKITGNTLFEECRFEEVITVHEGNICSPSCIDASVAAIRDFYGQFGYLETMVSAVRIPNLETGNIDLEFKIRESEKFRVETINIQGNTKTKSNVILRELALAPGDVFDSVRMDTSKKRLENTRFFDQVTMGPESTNVPGRKNLRMVVEEAKTGFFNFGVGFSTLENLVGTFEFTQSNFDLFNYKTKFQGGGQKFKLSFTLGEKTSHFLLSYENPWIFERRVAFGFDVFHDTVKYASLVYNEQRMGFDVYLRKRLFELVDGKISYSLESVDIENVRDDAPNTIKQEAGHRTVSKGRISLVRDTRDNFIFPLCGSRYEISTELAGGVFAGDTDYYRVEGRAAWWLPLAKFHKQVFSLGLRTGAVASYNGGKVPFFDKYFLGGPDNMRGYRYRDVGPKDPSSGEPLGGDTYFFSTVEYSFEVVNPVRFALFYDLGFVNAEDWDWDFSSYNTDFGFGFRIFLLGAPLRLDFGFPLKDDKFNDHGMRINFSVGVVF